MGARALPIRPLVRLATKRGSGHSGGSIGRGAAARALRRGERLPGHYATSGCHTDARWMKVGMLTMAGGFRYDDEVFVVRDDCRGDL